MKVIDIFERIASSTWQRIYLGEKYRISQSEETITDINLLELVSAYCPEVQVIKTSKDKEKKPRAAKVAGEPSAPGQLNRR